MDQARVTVTALRNVEVVPHRVSLWSRINRSALALS